MIISRTAVVLLLSTSVVSAQAFSSPPRGTPGNEGISRQHPFIFPGRYQYVLGDVVGTPRSVTALHLAADEALAPAPAQSVTVTLRLGHARTTRFAELDTTNQDNNIVGAVTVLDHVPMNLPATLPSARIPMFTGAAFAYDGVRGLVVEFETQRGSTSDWYGLDGARGNSVLEFGDSIFNGSGCQVPPNVTNFQSHGVGNALTDGTKISLPHAASWGPPRQGGVLVLGLSDPNTTFGGALCRELRASLDVLVPVTTDATGQVAWLPSPMVVSLPASVLPLTVYTQFAVLDPARTNPLAVALSSGRRWSLPVAPSLSLRYVVAQTGGPIIASTINVPVMLFN